MSEPSAAEVAKYEDMALDGQIADYMEEKDRERRGEMPDYLRGEPPEEEEPEREPPPEGWWLEPMAEWGGHNE